jgi:uncharacterized protein YbcV (DUF1398 family)
MSNIVDKLTEAQKKAMAIRPKTGGFPVLAEVLRQSGDRRKRWTLPSCQAVYTMKDGSVVQQGTPIVSNKVEVPPFDRSALIKALRDDQEGRTVFPEFLTHAWKAGVIGYDVDFYARKVTYYGVNGESYIEEYPAVEVKG